MFDMIIFFHCHLRYVSGPCVVAEQHSNLMMRANICSLKENACKNRLFEGNNRGVTFRTRKRLNHFSSSKNPVTDSETELQRRFFEDLKYLLKMEMDSERIYCLGEGIVKESIVKWKG